MRYCIASGKLNNSNYVNLRDSLYQSSMREDKILGDFQEEANKLNYQLNYPVYALQVREVLARFPENPIGALVIADLTNEHVMECVGEVFPLPAGRTPSGEELHYDPNQYAYTLVEFWASWCWPCRYVNPRWNDMLASYRSKGFQILGVSLDEDSTEWNKAIADDKLIDWLHISDFEDPRHGGNATTYGIQSIPYNLLIDGKGLIIHKNIKPDELEKFISENLN